MTLFLLGMPLLSAEPLLPSNIAEWSDWVLQENPSVTCIDRKVENCLWYGSLSLNLKTDEGNFTITGHADAIQPMQLPGGLGLWPVNVQINQHHVPVIDRNGVPTIEVPASDFTVQGTIVWQDIPKTLPIPSQYGTISLTNNGVTTETQVERTNAQQTHLVLTDQPIETQHSELTVSRLWTDAGIPTLTTHIQIQQSGNAVKRNLGQMTTDNSTLLSLHSELSHWVDEEQSLWVYAPVGTHTIEYTVALSSNDTTIGIPETPTQWPTIEYWAINSNIQLRQVHMNGLVPTTAQNSLLYEPWQEHPTYLYDIEKTVSFDVLLRGNPRPQPPKLTLTRTLWPKLTTTGFWIEDHIQGTMTTNQELTPPVSLQVQSIQQDEQGQSIVTHQNGSVSIPIRSPNLSIRLSADTTDQQPTFEPWNVPFDSVQLELRTPTGWRLVYWDGFIWSTLWGILINIGLSLLCWRHRQLSTLNGLLLTIGSSLGGLIAPVATISWNLIHWILGKRMQASLFILTVGWALLALQESQEVPFWQDKPHTQYDYEPEESFSRVAKVIRSPQKDLYTQQFAQPVQLGVGLPTWQGKQTVRRWNNGQPTAEAMTIWMLTPDTQRWLAIVAGLLLTFLGWRRANAQTMNNTIMKTLLLVGIAGTLLETNAMADTPVQEDSSKTTDTTLPAPEITNLLLNHHHPDRCQSDCLSIGLANLTIDEAKQEVHLWLEVHAIEDSILTLPGPTDQWSITEVQIEGNSTSAIRTSSTGYVEVLIPTGVSSVDIVGPLQNNLQLDWPIHPHRLDTNTGSWSVQGIQDNGMINGQIQLLNNQAFTSIQQQSLVTWTQRLDLQQQWVIHNTLKRNDTEHALTVPLTLLDGEKILSAHLRQQNDQWLAQFPTGVDTIQWTSQLPISQTLTLENPEYTETVMTREWQVQCGNHLHCTFEGLAPTVDTNTQKSVWIPYPNEALTISIEELQPQQGVTTQINDVQIHHNLQPQSTVTTLSFTVQSSTQEPVSIHTPPNVTITSLQVNGEPYPFTGESPLTVLSGIGEDTITVDWRSNDISHQRNLASPTFDIPTSNVNITVSHHKDLAVLWASSGWNNAQPPWLASIGLLLLMALALARHPTSTKTFIHWLLILCGLTFTGFAESLWLLGLLVIRDINRRTKWFWIVDVLLLLSLWICTLQLFLFPTQPFWFWNSEELQWYTDVSETIIAPSILLVSSSWAIGLWGLFVLYIGYQSLPQLWTDLMNMLSVKKTTLDQASEVGDSTE